MALENLRVLTLESRRAAEIELLLRKQGADPFVAPSVREQAHPDGGDAFLLLDGLEQQRFDLLVLMTGVGLSFWRNAVIGRFGSERADSALRATRLLVRGPKPASVLRSIGIIPAITVPEPNTWREIVDILIHRPEHKIAVQEYGRPNSDFMRALKQLGKQVESFALYRWELPEDPEPLREAARRLARRDFDVALFTSSVQLDHLLTVAEEQGVRNEALSALRDYTAVASVGPVMSEALVEQGITPDIQPASPKMGPLVYATAAEASTVCRRKRQSISAVV